MKKDIITIGFDKNGKADFGVRAGIQGLSHQQMKDLREMIVVAVGIAEDMWRRAQEEEQPPAQVES